MPPSDFIPFSLEFVLPRLWDGFIVTLQLTIASGIFGLILGLFIAFGRISEVLPLKIAAKSYITLFRGTPLLLQILFIYFAIPMMSELRLEAKPSGIIALSLNAAAYMAEIFRSGIESIDLGQSEASRALGLSQRQTMQRIILPQAFRRLIPPIVNELASLAKDTSLVSVIALAEMLYITQRIAAKYLRPWETFFWAAFGYLLLVMMLTACAAVLERRLKQRGIR